MYQLIKTKKVQCSLINSQSIITNRNTKFLPAWGPAVHHAHEVTTVEVGTDFPLFSVCGSSSPAGNSPGASSCEAESTSVEHRHALHCPDLGNLLSPCW